MKKILLFIFISLKLFSQYSIDNGIVYIYGRPVTGADIRNFEILEENFAADKRNVYFKQTKLTDIDRKSVLF